MPQDLQINYLDFTFNRAKMRPKYCYLKSAVPAPNRPSICAKSCVVWTGLSRSVRSVLRSSEPPFLRLDRPVTVRGTVERFHSSTSRLFLGGLCPPSPVGGIPPNPLQRPAFGLVPLSRPGLRPVRGVNSPEPLPRPSTRGISTASKLADYDSPRSGLRLACNSDNAVVPSTSLVSISRSSRCPLGRSLLCCTSVCSPSVTSLSSFSVSYFDLEAVQAGALRTTNGWWQATAPGLRPGFGFAKQSDFKIVDFRRVFSN